MRRGLLGRLDAGEARARAPGRAVRIAGEERWIAAEDAGLYRDALGVPPPPGLPETFLDDVPDAMAALVRRYARTHGPFPTAAAQRAATGSTRRRRCASSSGPASWSAASCCPGGTEREWCDSGRAAPRAPGEPRPPSRRGRGGRPARAGPLPARLAERRCPPARRGRPRSPARGAGPAAGRRAHPGGLGARRAARRLGAYSPPGSTSSAPAASSSGSAPARSAEAAARSRSISARTCASPGRRPPTPSSRRPSRRGPRCDPRAPRPAPLWLDLVAELDLSAPSELHTALWIVGRRGDDVAPLRAPHGDRSRGSPTRAPQAVRGLARPGRQPRGGPRSACHGAARVGEPRMASGRRAFCGAGPAAARRRRS